MTSTFSRCRMGNFVYSIDYGCLSLFTGVSCKFLLVMVNEKTKQRRLDIQGFHPEKIQKGGYSKVRKMVDH